MSPQITPPEVTPERVKTLFGNTAALKDIGYDKIWLDAEKIIRASTFLRHARRLPDSVILAIQANQSVRDIRQLKKDYAPYAEHNGDVAKLIDFMNTIIADFRTPLGQPLPPHTSVPSI